MLSQMSTVELRKAHHNLLTNIPGDPTFAATVGAILRNLIGDELAKPERVEADKKRQDEEADARRKAAVAAAPNEEEAKRIEADHEQAKKVADLAAAQAEERIKFEKKMREEREQIAPIVPLPALQPQRYPAASPRVD